MVGKEMVLKDREESGSIPKRMGHLKLQFFEAKLCEKRMLALGALFSPHATFPLNFFKKKYIDKKCLKNLKNIEKMNQKKKRNFVFEQFFRGGGERTKCIHPVAFM